MKENEQIECLRRELYVTRQQLCLAQEQSARYQQLLLQESCRGDQERRSDALHHAKGCGTSPMNCAGTNVVYKFVPPLEFLPAVFVAEYRDVIEIIEKYAQLYYRFANDAG